MYAIEIYECLIVLEPDIWRYVIKKVLLKVAKICKIYHVSSGSTEAAVLRCSVKQVFLKILQNSQENTCAGAFIPATLKERLLHRNFLVNFAKFLKIPVLQNTSKRLLLYYRYLRGIFCIFLLADFNQ